MVSAGGALRSVQNQLSPHRGPVSPAGEAGLGRAGLGILHLQRVDCQTAGCKGVSCGHSLGWRLGTTTVNDRGDLAERSITIRLAPIADADRRTESERVEAFDEAVPIIFGALLDGLSEGLRRYGEVRLDRLPRMADFCKWGVACERSYWDPGTFMATYGDAQASATEDVLEASPVGQKLREWLAVSPSFEGTATELLERLNQHLQHEELPRGWPANGSVMGKQFTRLAPSLRRLGFTVESTKTKWRNLWRLESPPQASGAV